MSMTTAPVTTGGSTARTMCAPPKCTTTPDRGEDQAGDQDRAGDVGRVAALGPDRGDRGDERRRGADVARDAVLDDEQEQDRGDAGHQHGQVGVQAHDRREDERGPEHRDDVLGAEADHARRGQPLVGPHDLARAAACLPPWTSFQVNIDMLCLLRYRPPAHVGRRVRIRAESRIVTHRRGVGVTHAERAP